ncbi:MAG: response regulator transcription factor [Firmicutes bacterium]|jgi:DNA-binding LytR/AlgR family response regulator|nr:response regulator transcription factor [Bacillota bacterium]
MYTIAICDDEQKEIDKIVILLKKYIKNNKLECNIKTFLSAKKLYCCINTGYIPDILFLDVYMEQENGVEVAKKLRQIGFENNIVFITTSKDHALEAYGVNAIQYLVKPLKEQQLFSIIKKLTEEYQKETEQYIILRVEGMLERIAICNIIYCESQKNYQCIHLIDGSNKKIRITMTALYECMQKWTEFIKLGSSYIVNLYHIKNFNSKKLTFTNGKDFYLPRGAYAKLKEAYFEYYCN